MAIRIRTLTDDERRTLDRLAHSRTAAARQVERAQIVWLSAQGQSAPVLAQHLGVHVRTVRTWLKRFNQVGLAGLEDQPRPGRPPIYGAVERAEVIATALTNPLELEQPFACWTLDRLQNYLNEEKGIGIKRSRIDEILIAEGLCWRAQETWFSEKAALDPPAAKPDRPLDPEFAEKRGPSRRSILSLPPTVR